MLFPKYPESAPYLMLAPMEGVGDAAFRKAIASIGGFDEAIRDFIRVPKNCHVKSLASVYDARELLPIPIAAQIMGSEPDLMCAMAEELMFRNATHINLNCGCPSNTVTGRGAGSSLLKEPNFLYDLVKELAKTIKVTFSVKMRSGFNDTSLFKENLHAVQEAGAHYVIIHPRTKVEGYTPPANWNLIKEAKSILSIPVVGNGDILNGSDALRMLQETGCDALMIGRGAIINPFIFHEIRALFSPSLIHPERDLEAFLRHYLKSLDPETPKKTQVNKLKQLMGFLFKGNEQLAMQRHLILTYNCIEPEELLQHAKSLLNS